MKNIYFKKVFINQIGIVTIFLWIRKKNLILRIRVQRIFRRKLLCQLKTNERLLEKQWKKDMVQMNIQLIQLKGQAITVSEQKMKKKIILKRKNNNTNTLCEENWQKNLQIFYLEMMLVCRLLYPLKLWITLY